MKKIVKPYKVRKPSTSTDVPSFARGKDQILKSPARLQRRKKNELGEFDDGKDNFFGLGYRKGKDQVQKEQRKFDKGNQDIVFKETPNWQYVDDGSGNLGIVDTDTGQTGTFALPDLEIVGNKPTIWDKIKNWFTNATIGAAMAEDPSIMTASGWKQNANGDWAQSPDEGSKQLADDLAVISSFSPTNYATAAGDALISADKLVDILNDIDLDSPAEILRKSALNEASAKLLDKHGLTTVKYFNRNPYEGVLPSYWINNPNKIDVLYNYNTMNTIHGLSSPITATATDQSLYDKGKDSGIHIKKKNRGKFTALKKRTGKSASWFKEHGTPAQKKMAVFALNARKWKH